MGIVTHALSGTPLYLVWGAMIQRCRNPKHDRYADYGGRGIEVCSARQSFEPFYSWARSNGYKTGLSLDRVDNDAGYCPENCQWANRSDQSRNRRKFKGTTSKYIGVSWAASRGLWQAYTKIEGKLKFGGRFLSEEDAARRRDEMLIAAGITSGKLNFPPHDK